MSQSEAFSKNGTGAHVQDAPPPLPRSLNDRPRDGQGQPEVGSYVFGPTLPAVVPFGQTALKREVAVIETRNPQGAREIERCYDALMASIKAVVETQQEEDLLLPDRIGVAAAQNAAVEKEQRAIEGERDTALKPFVTRLNDAEAELAERHRAAADGLAGVPGSSYDSRDPDASKLAVPEPHSKEYIAALLGLPYPLPAGLARPLVWLGWVLTAIVGTVFGISCGAALHLVPIDALTYHPLYCLGTGILGSGLVKAAAVVLGLQGHLAGQAMHIGPRRRFATFLLVTIMTALFFAGIDAAIVHNGLIASVRAREGLALLALRGQHITVASNAMDEVVYWMVAYFITPGLLALAVAEGFFLGRHDAVENLILLHQMADFAERTASFDTDPPVIAARKSLGQVRESLRQWAAREAEMRKAAAPFEVRWRRADLGRMADEAALRRQSSRLIEDKLGDAYGVKGRLDTLLTEAKQRTELPKPR